ncbi:MAG: trigger factor [Myxococcales bacterium]|nr:trigger factor [Myxococcales bacterium]
MQVQVESLSAARRQVKVQIPAGDVSRVWSQVVRRIGARVRIPGFRPGKAPKRLLERRYGSAIREEVLERVLTKAIPDAIEKAELQPLGRPELDDIGEIKDATELDITFTCDVLPTLSLDGYMGAEYTVDRVEADDEDIDAELETRRQRAAEVIDVDDAAQTDDVVRFRYCLRAEGPAAAEEPDWQERRVPVGGSIAWLSALVEGKSKTDKIVTTVDVPEDEDGDFAGTKAALEGAILGVQRRVVPDLDDTLAEKLGLADLAALREEAAAECARRAERRTSLARRRAVLESILASNEVDAPRTLVDHEIDNRMKQMFGGMNLGDNPALSRYLGEMRETMRAEAEVGVKQALVLSHLADSHELEVTEEDIDARIETMIAEMPDMADRIKESFGTEDARGHLRSQITEDKVLELILEKSTVTEGEVRHLRDPDEKPEEAEAAAAEADEAAAPAEAAAADEAAAPADDAEAAAE